MNKTAVKSFAVWARRKLISEITYRAGLLGVTENGAAEPLPQSTKDLQFFDVGTKKTAEVQGTEIAQRSALVAAIQGKARDMDYKAAFQSVAEEVAYTWFNRMAAIRFMEVNDYLPSRIRVLSSENPGKLEPDFVTTPFDAGLDLTPAERDRVLRLKDENRLDELFRMLFIKQCNKLHELLPELFEATSDYTELLLTLSFTDKDGVVYHLTHDIPESDFDIAHTDENGKTPGQVEIIGWLYQYYNTEPKDEVFALLKKNVKITKERIPAATQLFTPDWIVRYMVENSLGRLFVNAQCSVGSEQRTEAERIEKEKELAGKMGWKYYLPEAEQTPEVRARLAAARTSQTTDFQVEDLKIIDPCMGSGHILVYAFDVLMQIYETQGYTQRDAARLIVEKNLCGLDIDRRAYQLACFAVMMKARQYNRRILNGGVRPNLYAIGDSAAMTGEVLDFIANGSQKLRAGLQSVADDLADAKEYGSIIDVSPVDFDALLARFEEIRAGDYNDLFEAASRQFALNTVLPLVRQAQVMAQKYDVVVTNPPYMGASGMSEKLSGYVKTCYPDSKSDLFACFIEKGNSMTKPNGYNCMVTMQSWMFLSSFEKLREKILKEKTITNLMHMENMVMGIAFGTAVTVFQNAVVQGYKGTYNHIKLQDIENAEPKEFPVQGNRFAQVNAANFSKIPGSPIAYWVSEKFVSTFGKGISVNDISKYTGSQNITGNNEKYLRLFWEVSSGCIDKTRKWVFYIKGGMFRKWYGNIELVVDWSEDARHFYKTNSTSNLLAEQYRFREGITYTELTSGVNSFRYLPPIAVFDKKGPCIVDVEDAEYCLAFFNSIVAVQYFKLLNPTITLQVKDVKSTPLLVVLHKKEPINALSRTNVDLSKQDWDAYETSWNFKRHPLV
ncbi:BREX-1 system adenine-specific DNA-methyltransferase PglX [Ruthenibacterium lactatiformans]|uniref:BREX-1 system adenine-specific DNA-methyltransferase PglX n=1 Tax=Ruthenibacterium lactatiformans TaxID=1550024 RepID=UPI002671E4E6|nr:BREX-1 system adenine-specific DNA-methyltransferase PglX [Ruthenibacterium lactatiformans]